MPDATPPRGPRGQTEVLVPAGRLERWVLNFNGRHGHTGLQVVDGALTGAASDGSAFTARLPFGAGYGGVPDARAFALAVERPPAWGVLLVRKGGFAVARLAGERLTSSKTGQRHVQGRSKAGGQSQQRFARRRQQQARQAYEAAADHAARVLDPPRGLPVVTGGDRAAVEEVLADARLASVAPDDRFLAVPDPRRAVLDAAIADAAAVSIRVVNADA